MATPNLPNAILRNYSGVNDTAQRRRTKNMGFQFGVNNIPTDGSYLKSSQPYGVYDAETVVLEVSAGSTFVAGAGAGLALLVTSLNGNTASEIPIPISTDFPANPISLTPGSANTVFATIALPGNIGSEIYVGLKNTAKYSQGTFFVNIKTTR